MASISFSSFTYGWKYDVFLSFRGEDTRHGFTGYLYKALNDAGIYTFIDEEELSKGAQIKSSLVKEIAESRIVIVVFSMNYAFSTFCLDELVNIIELIKEKGRLVLPVFYDVDPSDVRHQRGTYKEALAKHEKRFKDDNEKVQRWRLALCQAADLSGYHLKLGNENEYEFISKIVKLISNIINRTPLHVADYPVGLDSQVLKLVSMLNIGSHEVCMIGIHGIGGIGKTTVARAVYNFIADQFEGICFLDNVRENSCKHGLVLLQETLLSKIIGKNYIKLGGVWEGISIIKHRLHRKKVLLVVDDVDTVEQLRATAGELSWFGSGSRVIITTRNKHLLTIHQVKLTYEVDELDKKDALELISWNAFNTNKVDSSYVSLLSRAVTYASGLPLALEVIGSYLFGKRILEWESALDQFERIPDKKIHNILKVSFDSLEEDHQKIFLDIACFFKGYALPYVKQILYSHHDFCPEYGIGVLIEKSLIKINVKGHVTLHDLIEDMGKEIVRQESLEEPGKRSRLWNPKDIIQVLEEKTGTGRIQAIILDFPNFEELIKLDGNAFKEMKNLKTLIIRRSCFSNGPKHLPNSLRVLEWWRYPSPSLPANFHPKKIVILELPQNSLISLNMFISYKKFVNMRVLNFDDCQRITKIPDVSGAPNLEELSFRYCTNLIKIHESVGFLHKLKMLNADGCCSLRTFPPIKLTSLEKLKLSYCHRLNSFPEILGKMGSISELEIMGTPIKELPFSIHNLSRLQRLVLFDCGVVQLPSTFFVMPELHVLIVGACTLLLPQNGDSEAEMSSMVFENPINLGLSGCHISNKFLQACLPLFVNVKELYLSETKFTILPACVKECYLLTELHLNGCGDLEKICGIPPNIKTLSARHCTSLRKLDLALLPAYMKVCCSLRTLVLDNCQNLQQIRGIPPRIRTLSARDCPSLTRFCRIKLLNERLHMENGDKEFCLPGRQIPSWFEHRVNGPSISFWFYHSGVGVSPGQPRSDSRNLLPAISVCVIAGPSMYDDIIQPIFSINGNKDLSEVHDHVHCREADHLIVFDMKNIGLNVVGNLHIGWNHVVCTISSQKNKLHIEKIGITLSKQGNSMEDIRFTDPLLLEVNYRSFNMGDSLRQFMQNQKYLDLLYSSEVCSHIFSFLEEYPLLGWVLLFLLNYLYNLLVIHFTILVFV